MTCNLKDLPEKTLAQITNINGQSHIIQYLMSMGLCHATFIKVIRKLFFSSNYVIEVGDERLVLRKQEAQCLQVTTLS